MTSFPVAIRRLRDDRAPAIGFALLVLVTAFVFGSAPRLLDGAADSALRGAVRAAVPSVGNITLVQETRLGGSGDDAFGPVMDEGAELEGEIPVGLQGLVDTRQVVVDSPRWSIDLPTAEPSFVRFRIQPGAETRIDYVTGRAPTDATRTVPIPPPPPPPDGEEPEGPVSPQTEAVVLEGAISAEAARTLGYEVGDTLPLVVDDRDSLVGRGHVWRAGVEIVGTFTVRDPEERFWYGDRALAQIQIRSIGGDLRFLDATALLDPATFDELMNVTAFEHLPNRYQWRFFVDPDRLQSEASAALITDLRRLETRFPPSTSVVTQPGVTATRSGLLPLVVAHQRQWEAAFAILTVAVLGPAAVALAALGLIAILAARRRRMAIAIVRGRGASIGQIIRAVTMEGAVLAIPAAGLAAVGAILLLPDGPNRPTAAAVAVVAAVAIVLLVATALPGTAATTPTAGVRDPGAPRGVRPRRLVFEGLVAVLAIAGAYLLRERGVRGASSATDLAQADPLIAAVPTLVGIAAGLAAIRLVPLPLRLLARIASAGRGLVPVLALRRATSGGTTAAILIVLLATTSIGAFTTAALGWLDQAAEAAAWQEVGAPYQVSTTGSLPIDVDPATLPGVEAAATAYRTTVIVGIRNLRVDLLIVDAEAYNRVVAGTRADPGLPADMLRPVGSFVPAIVSTAAESRPNGPAIGGRLDLVVDGYHYPVEPIEARDHFPSMPIDGVFMVVSRDQFRALQPEARLLPNRYYLRAGPEAGPAIREAMTAVSPSSVVRGGSELVDALRQSPVTAAIVVGMAAAALVAVGYAALAVASALALAGSARAVEVAHLRTLGLSRREGIGLVVVEHGPTVVLAFVAGILLGVGLFVVLRPGLGLDVLVGSELDVPVIIAADRLALVGLAIVAIVAVAILLAAALQRRAAPVAALRRGFE